MTGTTRYYFEDRDGTVTTFLDDCHPALIEPLLIETDGLPDGVRYSVMCEGCFIDMTVHSDADARSWVIEHNRKNHPEAVGLR